MRCIGSLCLVNMSALLFRERARSGFGLGVSAPPTPFCLQLSSLRLRRLGAEKEMVGVDETTISEGSGGTGRASPSSLGALGSLSPR